MADGLHYDASADADDADEGSDDYKSLASEAFPDEEWTPDRVAALKSLIKLCMGGDSGASDDEPPDDKHAGLALLFGGPKKK